jgi:carbon-monoxide dehydrogenase large subunit
MAATSARWRSTRHRPGFLARYLVIDDVGTVINPITLKGQIHGGVAQGVGQALMEQVIYDPTTARS